MEKRRETLGADDGAEGIGCGEVISARREEGVVWAALELQARFEDFGGDVEDRGSEVGEEAWVRESA